MPRRWFFAWFRDEAASAGAHWLLGAVWGLPFVPPLIYGTWSALRGSWGPDVALWMFVAFVVGLVGVLGTKSYLVIRRFSSVMEAAPNQTDNIRPSIEMLEAGRRVMEQRHVQLIQSWRALVAYANHQAMEPGETRTVIEIVESDPRFMSLRRWLSDGAKQAMRGKPMVLDGSVVPPTLPFALECILEDIDKMEERWNLV